MGARWSTGVRVGEAVVAGSLARAGGSVAVGEATAVTRGGVGVAVAGGAGICAVGTGLGLPPEGVGV